MKIAMTERERIQSMEEEDVEVPAGIESDYYDDPEEATYKSEQRQLLWQAIEALPPLPAIHSVPPLSATPSKTPRTPSSAERSKASRARMKRL